MASLEQLIRSELKPEIEHAVRALVVDLAREELHRLNGKSGAGATPGLSRAQPAESAPPSARVDADPSLRHCNGCGRDLAVDAFSPGHYRCRECRNRAQREREHRRTEEPEPG